MAARPQSQVLGKLELAVMEFLWSRGQGDPKSLHAELGRPREISHNTVQSTLKRLHEKGLLERQKVSHAYVYRPAVSRETFQRDALEAVVNSVMDGEPDAMLSAFVDLAERAGGAHLARLEQLVAQRMGERGDNKGDS